MTVTLARSELDLLLRRSSWTSARWVNNSGICRTSVLLLLPVDIPFTPAYTYATSPELGCPTLLSWIRRVRRCGQSPSIALTTSRGAGSAGTRLLPDEAPTPHPHLPLPCGEGTAEIACPGVSAPFVSGIPELENPFSEFGVILPEARRWPRRPSASSLVAGGWHVVCPA
jgi:hypothetical protein